jgi:hypothetical protein
MNHKLTKINSLFLAALLLLFLTIAVQGQAPGPPGDRSNPERDRQQDRSQREWQLRNFGLEPPKTEDPEKRKLKAVGEQIDQDFNRILVLHNKIVRAVTSEKALKFDFISEATGEINKRASRLQSTLGLREPDAAEKKAETSTNAALPELKTALLTLCKQIESFVTNPVIEKPGTINADELVRARRDLEKIISLSDQIQKESINRDKHKN